MNVPTTALEDPLEYLLSLDPLKANRWDLQTLCRLVHLIDHPQKDYHSIHIAGTNGKGSVAFKIAKSLSLAGYRVGCFTSPHLACYRERITINGQKILARELNQWLIELFDLTRQENLNNRFFELTTLVALMAFSHYKVDLAVIETGIGGRLDPTNIICPLATVITTVDFDHCKLLGNSLNEIATEKGGIIKEGTPVILGPRARLPPIVSIAKEKKAPLYQITTHFSDPDQENQAIAAKTLEVLTADFPVPPAHLTAGLAAKPPCRFEIDRNVVYDVAHNPVAFQKLFEKMNRTFPHQPIHLLLAFSKEKEIERCLDQILDNIAYLYLAALDHPRLLQATHLKNLVEKRSFQAMKTDYELASLVVAAKKQAEHDSGVILVAGSFYIMEPVKKIFKNWDEV